MNGGINFQGLLWGLTELMCQYIESPWQVGGMQCWVLSAFYPFLVGLMQEVVLPVPCSHCSLFLGAWVSTTSAHVIMCLTPFFPPAYKLLWCRDPLILFTVVSLLAVTLPGSETLGGSCWINGHADCEVVSRPLFSCPWGYSWQRQTCQGLSWSLLTKSLREGKGSCLLTGQLPTALVERRAFLPFAVGVSQKLTSLL